MLKLACCGAFAALALAAPSLGQTIVPGQLMPHINVLADDGYEGRASGTAGGQRTEAYILEAFARAGLRPGFNDGWRQVVSVVERTPGTTRFSFQNSGRAIPLPDDAAVLTGRDALVELKDAPVVFAGYATDAEVGGMDVKDAAVLMNQSQPPGRNGGESWQDRREKLFAAGAAAVIAVQTADRPWNAAALRSRTSVNPLSEGHPLAQGSMSRAAAAAVVGEAQLVAADAPGFKARRLPITASTRIETHIKRVEPANIVGMVKGAGSKREAVVLMGHWDHTGVCRPEGSADRICNGAVDNASGIAVLIEVARAIAAGPRPERDVYFRATALEEGGGFLGATAFASAPPQTVGQIVAVLNIDSIAIAPAGLPVAIIGRARFPSLDRVVDATAKSLGRKVDRDDEANVMIERQDGWAFTKLGIPSIMASGSFSDMKLLQGYLSSSYHQPNDDLKQTIELAGAAEDADLHVALVRALADPTTYPAPPASGPKSLQADDPASP